MSRLAISLAACGLALSLAGCAVDANPVRDLAVATGVTGGEPRPAPDFVTGSRPASVDYMPIGVSAPRRTSRPKDAAAVAGAEKEMNELRSATSARGASARRAASGAPPAPAKPAAPTARPQ